MEKTLHEHHLGEIRRTSGPLAPDALDRIIRARNREVAGPVRYVAKKKLLPFYQEAKEHRPEHWRTWGVSPAEEALLVRTLQVKPRRTASGVATVTVLTKPWPCSSACLYCPNDVRMPKSYLHDEPACQRAERNWFDPYLQVTARLRTLHQMGHVTDKVELIVSGRHLERLPGGIPNLVHARAVPRPERHGLRNRGGARIRNAPQAIP